MGTVADVVLAADQISKSLVLAAHPAAGAVWLVRRPPGPQHRGQRRHRSGYPILVSLAALAITARRRVRAARRPGGRRLCLAAVVGGAAGNLADRLFRAPGFGRGGVVDWIDFGAGGGSWTSRTSRSSSACSVRSSPSSPGTGCARRARRARPSAGGLPRA